MTRTNTGDQPAANRGNTSDFDWHPTGEQEDRMRRQCLEDIERLQRETDIASRELPIEKVRDDFDQALTEFDVVSVEASTGAGKSLDLGVWTVEALGGKNARVAMTQPRRDAAEGVCVAAAARHGLKFGEDICFTTSEFKGNRRDTKLQISTTGVLINKFKKDPTLADYNAVIVDEAHERDLNIDLTIGLLKRANQLRTEAGQPTIKIILASATLEQGKFAEFFGINEKARIQSEGKLHKVNEVYTESEYKFATNPVTGETVERPYPAIATQQVIDILSTTKQGDILVFMPGIQSIRDVQRQVQFSPEIRDQAVEILILHGSNTQKERSYVLQGSRDKSTRRVVISTNMAETSVTVPGIKYVVDGARKNEMQYDASTGLETLTDVPASQAECKQRRGRAGRITTGEYHTVLTEEEYGKLEKYPKPEILRRELDGVVLEMLRLGITDVENFDLPDKAPKKNIKEALRKLEMLGAITTDNQLTEIGKLMAELPLEPRHARVVVAAMEKGCVREAVAVTAAIGKNSIFRRPGKAEFAVAEKALKDSGSRYVDERAIRIAASEVLRTKQQKLREGTSSDWVLFLNIFKKFMRAGNKHAFCEEFALDYESLEGVADNFHRVIKELKRSKIDVSSSEDENSLTESILMGYAPDHLIMQTQSRNGVEFNRVDRGDRDVRINSSSIAFSNKPELAVCLDLEPGKGTKVIGRRGSEETEFKYAVGVHPVTSERLRAVVPHRVKRGESPQDFDFKNGQVLSKFSYDYKTQSGGWTSIPIDYVPDQNPQATEFFAKQILAFTDKKLQDFFQVINNKEVEQELQNLYHRSRGQTEQFDLKDWYARKLGTSISVNEAKKAGSTHYHLNTTEIVSEAQKREVELAAPAIIAIAGENWPVNYKFRPANPDSWSESEKTETFEVVVDLNRSSFEETYQKIMSIKPGDVHAARAQIGIFKESELLLMEVKLGWEVLKSVNIEELQKAIEERYLTQKWNSFVKPTYDKINVIKGGSFPDLASLSAEPIVFATLANGQSVLAYPAWDQDYNWSPEGEYIVKYFKTKEEAEQKKQEALAREQRRVDRDTLTGPAKEKYIQIEQQVSNLGSNYLALGLTYDDYYHLYQEITKAQSLMQGLDSDPQAALTVLEGIHQTLQKQNERAVKFKKEVQRVTDFRDELQPSFTEKTKYGEYQKYGISSEEYERIRESWVKTERALEGKESRYGSATKPPDYATAEKYLQEIKTFLDSKPRLENYELTVSLNSLLQDNSFTRIVTVSDNRVKAVENAQREATGESGEITIGGSGRHLYVSGNVFTFVYGSGQTGQVFSLSDGQYVIGRDVAQIIEVKTGPHNTLEAIRDAERQAVDRSAYTPPPLPARSSALIPSDYGYGQALESSGYRNTDVVPPTKLATLGDFFNKPKNEKPTSKPVVPETVLQINRSGPEESKELTPELLNQFTNDLELIDSLVSALKPYAVEFDGEDRGKQKNDGTIEKRGRPPEKAPMAKKKIQPTEKERAMDVVYKKYAGFRSEIADLKNTLANKKPTPGSIRGRLGALRGAVESTFTKLVTGEITNDLASGWLEVYKKVWSQVDQVIAESQDAQEFISAEITTRVDLQSKLRERLLEAAQNGEELDVKTSLVGVLSEF